jgi:hypothetical protein
MSGDFIERHAWGVDLRAIRADRPKLARTGARAQTFGAALEQAEQLWLASEAVGPIASPLLLFYGLAQAGRAICAAGIPGPSWRAAESHGLAFQFQRPSSGTDVDLTAIAVKPHGDGLIQHVARVLKSPVLAGPATLSALIGSLDAHLLFTDAQIPDPKPIQVHEWNRSLHQIRGQATKSLLLTPVPPRFTANTEPVPGYPTNLDLKRIIPPTGEQVADWLMAYPTLSVLGAPTEVIGPEHLLNEEDWRIKLVWDEGAPMLAVEQSDWTIQHMDEPHVIGWSFTRGVALPAISGNTESHDLVIGWWLVLYSLSMLARYYPKEWTEILNVDASPLAVPLEHVLSVARAKVPAIVSFRLRLLRDEQEG